MEIDATSTSTDARAIKRARSRSVSRPRSVSRTPQQQGLKDDKQVKKANKMMKAGQKKMNRMARAGEADRYGGREGREGREGRLFFLICFSKFFAYLPTSFFSPPSLPRHEGPKLTKHLLAGKMSNGTRDRR